jgi:hypothetical protein
MLLNKTAGRVAVPVFWTLIKRWPTPESLAKGYLFFFASIIILAHVQGVGTHTIYFDS